MIITPSTNSRKDLSTLFSIGAIGLLSDAELLARFTAGAGDAGSEAAFEAIVARHGAMVLGVCRRILRDTHAANDAFQATFLVLARKASAIRVEDSLGRWLYEVTIRVARRARSTAIVERARVQPLSRLDPVAHDRSFQRHENDDLRFVIDEEIARLPDRYRSAVLLCYLEGLTQEQASIRLGCPIGTVQSRLHRARERLRCRLTRRGLAPAIWTSAMLATATSRAEVPSPLVASTNAMAVAILRGVLAGIVPAPVSALVAYTLRGMIMTKGLWAGIILVAVGLSATGAGVLAGGGGGGGGEEEPKKPPLKSTLAAEPESKLSIAEQFAVIRAEFDAKEEAMWAAMKKVEDQSQQNTLYGEMAPDKVAYCRRMIDLAFLLPTDPGSRDALIWVVNNPGMSDVGPYGDEFARAASMLVRHHGDDPEAIRVGLVMDNDATFHRDALLQGFYASAKSVESKGLARLALAMYLKSKPMTSSGSGKDLARK